MKRAQAILAVMLMVGWLIGAMLMIGLEAMRG